MVIAKENIGTRTLSKMNLERVEDFKRSWFFLITTTSTLTITKKKCHWQPWWVKKNVSYIVNLDSSKRLAVMRKVNSSRGDCFLNVLVLIVDELLLCRFSLLAKVSCLRFRKHGIELLCCPWPFERWEFHFLFSRHQNCVWCLRMRTRTLQNRVVVWRFHCAGLRKKGSGFARNKYKITELFTFF